MKFIAKADPFYEILFEENVVTSDVELVNTQWVGKYFLGIYPRLG